MTATVLAPVAPQMLDELNAIDARVREHLSELLDLFEAEAPVYARRYAASILTAPARGGSGPRPPVGMHNQLAKCIREIVMDELAAQRYVPARHLR